MAVDVVFVPGWQDRIPTRELLDRIGRTVLDAQKRLVPVDTGRLRDSLGAEVSGDSVKVGSHDVDYARYVEFGTSRMRAQPFLRPSLDHIKGGIG